MNCDLKQGPSIERAALIVSIFYASILFITAAVQHYLFGTQVWDIGLFEQFSWLISEGEITAISSLRQVAPLEDHFSLLLLHCTQRGHFLLPVQLHGLVHIRGKVVEVHMLILQRTDNEDPGTDNGTRNTGPSNETLPSLPPLPKCPSPCHT